MNGPSQTDRVDEANGVEKKPIARPMRASPHIFLVIFLLALLARVGGPSGATLNEFPPGLWFDEGLNGVDAWNTLHGGGFRLVYPDVFPREPLLVWILSAALWLGGPKVIVMRFTTALLGSLACVAFFVMLRAIYREKPLGFPLAGAFVLATLHWHAWFSRLVFRTNLVPLLACLLVLAMSAAARRTGSKRLLAWAGAGALAGLGFYTYLSWYFFAPVILVWFWALTKSSENDLTSQTGQTSPICPTSPPARTLLYFALGAALAALPLLLHYLFHPQDLTSRPEAVSPLRDGIAPAVALIVRNVRDVILMFGIRGDHVPTHNIPWSPVLDPVWFAFFAAGFVRLGLDAFWGATRDRRAVAWLAWLVFMSLPSVLSQTDSANTLRNLGASPAAAFLVARGWWWAFEASRRMGGGATRILTPLLIALLLWGAGFQVVKLWVRHPRTPETVEKFHTMPVVLADFCRPDLAKSPLFVPPEFMNKSFEFLTIGREDIRPFDPIQALAAPEEGPPRDHRVLCSVFFPYYPALRELFPGGQVEEAKLFQGEQPLAWIFRIPARSLLSPEEAQEAAVRFAKVWKAPTPENMEKE